VGHAAYLSKCKIYEPKWDLTLLIFGALSNPLVTRLWNCNRRLFPQDGNPFTKGRQWAPSTIDGEQTVYLGPGFWPRFLTPIWDPDLRPDLRLWLWFGPRFGLRFGPRFGTPIWDSKLGLRFGTLTLILTPIWDPDLGPRFGAPIWDPDLGPRFGTQNCILSIVGSLPDVNSQVSPTLNTLWYINIDGRTRPRLGTIVESARSIPYGSLNLRGWISRAHPSVVFKGWWAAKKHY
jgi:hypothetical protein